MPDTTTGYFDRGNGVRLYYETAGEGDAVVFLHAGFVDSGMWDGQWEAFAQTHRVIRYDRRGFGKSTPTTEHNPTRDDLRALLDHLRVEQTALIGCSMGGELAIDFTLENPDKVTALIPVSATPVGFEMQGEPPRYLIDMMDALKKGDVERTSELQLRIWIDGMYREPDAVDPVVRAKASEMNLITLKKNTHSVEDGEPLDPPAVGRISGIKAPTLIIVGGLDHPEITKRAADLMVDTIADASKVVIDGTAHMPSMEKPDEFNEIVLDFLG